MGTFTELFTNTITEAKAVYEKAKQTEAIFKKFAKDFNATPVGKIEERKTSFSDTLSQKYQNFTIPPAIPVGLMVTEEGASIETAGKGREWTVKSVDIILGELIVGFDGDDMKSDQTSDGAYKFLYANTYTKLKGKIKKDAKLWLKSRQES